MCLIQSDRVCQFSMLLSDISISREGSSIYVQIINVEDYWATDISYYFMV